MVWPFDIETDYLDFVDGRPRDDSSRGFLAARGIILQEGSERGPEDANTMHSLGERKTRLFLQALKMGIDPAASAEALLKKLRQGIRTALGSSRASAAILEFGNLIALAWRGSLEPERARRVIRDAGCPVIVFRVQA